MTEEIWRFFICIYSDAKLCSAGGGSSWCSVFQPTQRRGWKWVYRCIETCVWWCERNPTCRAHEQGE